MTDPPTPTAPSDPPTPSPEVDAPRPPDTAAVYLARRMIADRGYKPGIFPEARALAEAADIVLTRADGMNVQILCIVDREHDPARRFDLTLDAVVAAAKPCLDYTGKINFNKIPVGVQIWEVGPNAGAEPELARLRGLARNFPGRDKVVVSAWTLDPATARVTSTARWGGLFAGRGRLERLLQAPRKPAHEIVPPTPAALSEDSRPWLTYAMIAALALVFAGELLLPAAPAGDALSPDNLTLVALGGLFPPLVDGGEWFRLLTAAVLHGGVFHLALNALALLLAGTVVERLFGRAWLLALFVLGALGGTLLSYLLNPPEVVSVGASGAIMGLLAAAFVSSFRLPEGAERTQLQMQLMQVLVPSLLPLAWTVGGHIDYAAHLGGTLVGALLGLVLLRTWPQTEPLPRFRRAAQLVAAAGLAVLAYGATQLAAQRADYVQEGRARDLRELLIPTDELPPDDAAALARSADLAAKYPRDPRARLFNAIRMAEAGSLDAAEAEVRLGLAEQDILTTMFPDHHLEWVMRALLVELLQGQGRHADAREAARPACSTGPGGAVPEPLQPYGVCGP